jgi:hypothetical protein
MYVVEFSISGATSASGFLDALHVDHGDPVGDVNSAALKLDRPVGVFRDGAHDDSL